VADAQQRGIQAGSVELKGKTFLSVGFYRRTGDSSRLFHMQESADLGFWNELPMPQQILGTPQNMGDGTEHVNVRGTLPITGPGAVPRGFLRVAVEKP
jgi:hypothetical protein